MIRKGRSGGLLSLSSVLNPNKQVPNFRMASASIREAARIGLQTLYKNPDEVLAKYADFDIVQAMKDRKDSKLLWVRARSIDADKVNTNGDFFAKSELLKEVDYKGKKVPAYKTFEGVPIYTNHKNDDIELAKGMVVYAEWDEDENCVYCTFFIDEEAYPDIARGIRQGYLHDVSMGTSVMEGECSICSNRATVEKEWCDCLKKYKGKKHPDKGESVYEKNYGLKFIELSVVGDGAFDTCEIHELYEPDEVISFADSINKKAEAIQTNITLAAAFGPAKGQEKYAFEDCLRQVKSTTESILKVAQVAGNLVGGDVMSLGPNSQNATVTNILRFLGLDAQSGLNILDLLNLALNFLEVAVMTLFSRRDNVDLTHVSKISKAMSELQTTMQDLIDDGMSGAGTAQPQQPQNPQAGAPAPPPPQPGAQPVMPAPNVGTMVTPNAQTQAPAGFGGGIADQTQVFASTLINKIARLKTAITQEEPKEVNNNNYIGGLVMSFMKELKHAFNTEHNVYEVEAPTGHKIAISSTGNVRMYNNGQALPMSMTLTSEEQGHITSGDLKTAGSSVLNRFMRMSSSDQESDGIGFDEMNDSVLQRVNKLDHEPPANETREKQLESLQWYNRAGEPLQTMEERNKPLRQNKYDETNEEKLSKPSWVSRKGVKIIRREKLLEEARRGAPTEVIENRLEEQRKNSKTSPVKRVEKVIEALAKTAIKYGLHPQEVIRAAQDLLDDSTTALKDPAAEGMDDANGTPDILTLTKQLKENGDGATMADANEDPSMAVADGLSDQIDDSTTSKDLVDSLQSALGDLQSAVTALQNAVDGMKGDEGVVPKIEDTTPPDSEQVGAEISAKADSSPASPDASDVQAGVSGIANTMDQLGVGSDDVLNAVGGESADSLQRQIENEKQPTATAARSRNFERIAYYGFNKKASKKDIVKTLCGNLADYVLDYKNEYNFRPKNLANVVIAFTERKNTARKLIAQALNEKRNVRTAGVQITDTQLNEKRLNLKAEDIGVDVASPDFQDKLREKVVETLSNDGYKVDPNTFSMNEVTVSPDGNVSVRVFTRFERTYDADTQSSMHDDSMQMGAENNPIPPTDMTEETPGQEMDYNTPSPNMMPPLSDMPEKMAKKNMLMSRSAQALGAMPPAGGIGGGGMGGPAQAPAAGDPNDPLAGLDAGGQAGVSSFTNPTAAPGEEPADDFGAAPGGPSEVLPGVKKPWGTVCPQCQSTNVEVSGGEGKCNDCGAQLHYEFTVRVSPPAKTEDYKGTFDYKSYQEQTGQLGAGEPSMGGAPGDVGLGAATGAETPGLNQAPAPAPAAPGGTPGMPPVPGAGAMPAAPPAMASNSRLMTRVSYITDPEVFLNANNKRYASQHGVPLPVGMTCPSCASRNVEKTGANSFCSQCQTLSISSVEPLLSDPTKLHSSIVWIS